MPTYKKKPDFFETEEGIRFENELRELAANVAYNTNSSYSANSDRYPDNQIPFVDKHMAYMRNHPKTDPFHYLANLRLIIRLR